MIGAVRADVGQVSTQAVYDVLNTLTGARHGPAHPAGRVDGPLRAPRRATTATTSSAAGAARVVDVDCATETAPCLDTSDLEVRAPGFVVDEAEVTFWGLCDTCSTGTTGT